MKITALETKTHKPGMYRAAVDNKPVGYLSADDIIELNISIGRELSDKDYRLLLNRVKYASYLSSARRYADRRLHSSSEVVTYLRLKGCDSVTAQKIAQQLSSAGLIDEEKLAQAYVHDSAQFKPMSKKALQLKLRQKRIDLSTINQAIEESEYDEEAALDSLIAQKGQLSSYQNHPDRFFRYLLSKGFSYDSISKRLGRPGLSRGNRGGDGTSLD